MTIIKKIIGVDAGLIWVGDPCYLAASKKLNNWGDFCSSITDHTVCEPLGKERGLAIGSGLGDGAYEVTIETLDGCALQGYVSKVSITFIEKLEDTEDAS